MRILKTIGVAAALASAMPAAGLAADIIEAPMPEVIPVVVGGWYLRGDIGMSNQKVDDLYNVLMDSAVSVDWISEPVFSSAPTFQVGIGYEVNDYFRMDGTIQYRGKADFDALDRYDTDGDGVWDGTNQYEAEKSEWVLMANAYFDLGTFAGITPYLGGGIGASRNAIDGYQDINTPNQGVAYAGLAMDITERATIDFSYSYMDLGDAQTGNVIAYDGTDLINNPTTFEKITSNDFKLGLRYKLY